MEYGQRYKLTRREEHHYAFQEFKDEKVVHTDYCHKKCWDKFIESVGNTDEAMGIVRGMKTKMQEMGILPEEVVEVGV